MKKKFALGIAVVGAALLTLSLMAFGIGAATNLNPASAFDAAATTTLPVVNPVRTTPPSPSAPYAAPAGTVTGFTESADPTDPMESDAFKAMTPDEQADAIEWLKTQHITAACMKDKGFDYTFVAWWKIDRSERPMWWVNTLPESEWAAGALALEGDTGSGADYHWDDAGCVGYAVHTMGNDNEN